jgi:hypothetical protein
MMLLQKRALTVYKPVLNSILQIDFTFFKNKNPDEKFIRIVIDVGNEGVHIPYRNRYCKYNPYELRS